MKINWYIVIPLIILISYLIYYFSQLKSIEGFQSIDKEIKLINDNIKTKIQNLDDNIEELENVENVNFLEEIFIHYKTINKKKEIIKKQIKIINEKIIFLVCKYTTHINMRNGNNIKKIYDELIDSREKLKHFLKVFENFDFDVYIKNFDKINKKDDSFKDKLNEQNKNLDLLMDNLDKEMEDEIDDTNKNKNNTNDVILPPYKNLVKINDSIIDHFSKYTENVSELLSKNIMTIGLIKKHLINQDYLKAKDNETFFFYNMLENHEKTVKIYKEIEGERGSISGNVSSKITGKMGSYYNGNDKDDEDENEDEESGSFNIGGLL